MKKDNDEKRERGRPSKYRSEFAKVAQKMCAFGATDRDLAEAFGVTTVTIWNWQSTHPEFFNALIVGKGPADLRVERGLYQRAVGYSYDAVKIHQYEGEAILTPYVEHVPPDPGAAKLWLTNRKPKEWAEKQVHEHAFSFREYIQAIHQNKRPAPAGDE